jgi:formate dehydrogenase major subunit
MTNDWVDIRNADAILVIGANPAENHPASLRWVNYARDNHGAKLIVVDPRFTRTAATADFYTSLRSGTDVVLLGALINYTLENKLYNEEYVRYYTNALTLINPDFKGPTELDGLFSGYDAEKRTYDTKTWQYQTETKLVTVTAKDPATGKDTQTQKEVAVPKQAASLDDPNCVFAHLKDHYARFTPEMVTKICGTSAEDFQKVAEMYCATCSAPDKTGTVLYAMGQTQHTVGTQNVRSLGILQLLLGNIGMPGGGINALRGESNVQGSTDMALLYHNLPGYLGAPNDKEADFATHSKRYSKTSYWSNGPAFVRSLLKAWYGDAAVAANDHAYGYLPKTSGDYSWISLFEAMYAGKIKGLVCMGQNPAVGGPNARLERKALEKLDWLVAMDLFETETAGFWKGPGVNSSDIQTEVFLLPAADAIEKAGSIATSGRRAQWRPKVAAIPGEAREDMWILDQLAKALKQAYAPSSDSKDFPILDLVWDYGDPPDVERVAREINGFAVEDVKDSSGKVLVKKGELLPGFATIASAADPSTVACGCWIYSGYFYPTDDGTGTEMPAVKRRGQKDPGDMGFYPYWGYTWPANRRILYNRASARPDGTPWAENKKVIWWDPSADSGSKDAQGNPVLGKWVGYDVPDFPATKAPTAKGDPAKSGLSTHSGTDAFIMQPDGKGWLFTSSGCKEGPLPEHYEPLESPVKNMMSSVQNNPVIKLWDTDAGGDIGDTSGTADKFPIVCTTYRLTEMWQTGSMSRNLPWLVEAQPNMFVEVGKELAAEKGIKNGDQVIVSSARGEIQMVALVTARWKPFAINGQKVHEVGMPWHYGWKGLATGAIANELTPHAGDANTMIPEYKAFLVDIRKA